MFQRVRESDQIISDTVHMNADAVATQIEKIHIEETTALFPFPWENDSIMCCPLFARFVQQRERKQ